MRPPGLMAFPYLFLPDRDDAPARVFGTRTGGTHYYSAQQDPPADDSNAALPSDPAEHARVARIRAGDDREYAALFAELHVPLREFAATYAASGSDAEEIVQDVFLDLWIRRAEWSPRYGIRAYLFRAVRNRATDTARHARVAGRVGTFSEQDTPVGMGEAPPLPGADSDLAELTAVLRDLIMALPPARRRAAVLRWRHGLSYGEIAEAMGTSVAAVTMHIARAREAIRPVVERYRDP